MQPARLWLIRHGETDWNRLGRVQGHTPTELNAQGHAQARHLGQLLARRSADGGEFSAVYASDLPRAYQTAEHIAAAVHLTVQRTAELRERSFGPYEGFTSQQLQAARAALGLQPNNDLADWTGMPGIESNDTLWTRVAKCLRGISHRHADQDVLVVTHGGVVARAVYRTLGIPDGAPRRFPLSNGIAAVLQWREPINSFYLLTLADLGLVTGQSPQVDTATAPSPG